MKIGIITKIGKNYGALLQAYALKKTIEDYSIESHIIKYTPKNSKRTYCICKYKWGVRGFIANIKSLVHFRSIKRGSKKMLQFREKYFSFVGSYDSNEALTKNPPNMDKYVTGSDQVWNPLLSFDSAYYLDFISSDLNVVKASYAASIGLKAIPKEYENEFIKRLRKMDYITVREANAKQILDSYDLKSSVVPDPTLLLTNKEWDDIMIKPKTTEKYILCYFVSYKDEYKKIVDKIQEILGYKVINLMTSEESSKVGDIKIRDASVEEFIGLFKYADFIVTSSFHGTIFSIIYEKNFCSMVYKQTSSRLTELLESFNLSSRIVHDYNEKELLDITKKDCVYDEKLKNDIRKNGLKAVETIIKL